jgi:hypothetical protein
MMIGRGSRDWQRRGIHVLIEATPKDGADRGHLHSLVADGSRHER